MVWKPDYVAVDGEDGLRAYATRSALDVDDAFVQLAATSASRAIDTHTGRQFGKADGVQARQYEARWDRRRCAWVVDIDDLYDLTGLAVAVDAGPVVGYHVEPVNAILDGKVYEQLLIGPYSTLTPTFGATRVTVTSDKFGWPDIPDTVKQAAHMQGSRLLWRRQAPAGVAGSPDSGSEVRLLSKLDPDVAVILNGYLRWWAAA